MNQRQYLDLLRRVEELEKRASVVYSGDATFAVGGRLDEVERRLETIEERKKPGPKPKHGAD